MDIIGAGRCAQSIAMLESKQHERVALLSQEDQEKIRELLAIQGDGIRFEEFQEKWKECQVVLLSVAQYMEPAEMVPRVCNHACQIMALQKKITEQKAQHFYPPGCDHLEMNKRLGILKTDLAEARMRPAVREISHKLQDEVDQITLDTYEAGDVFRSLGTQLANTLTLAEAAAPAAP